MVLEEVIICVTLATASSLGAHSLLRRCPLASVSLASRSMASVPTRFCIVVGRIPCDRGEDLLRLYQGHKGMTAVLLFQYR